MSAKTIKSVQEDVVRLRNESMATFKMIQQMQEDQSRFIRTN